MERTLIKNGWLLDGSGGRGRRADVLVRGEYVEAIGGPFPEEGARLVDADGGCVTPGFIDPHSHNDYLFVHDKENANALLQGVTTQLVGLCGLGPVPVRTCQRADAARLYSGIFGDLARPEDGWSGVDAYLQDAGGARINVAAAVGHCALRAHAAGYTDAPYDGDVARTMRRELEAAMEQGAVGFSTGLDYYPARVCGTAELVDLCRVVEQYGGAFLMHMRPFAATLPPLDEVFDIGIRSGVRTHLLHTKTYAPASCAHPEQLLDRFDGAMRDGCDLSVEFYPYTAFASYAMAFLPSWASAGGYADVMRRLADPALRKRLATETQQGYENFMIGATPAFFTDVGGLPALAGRSFNEIATQRGQQIGEMIVDLLREAQLQVCMRSSPPADPAVRRQLRDDWMALLRHPAYTVGSDAIDAGPLPHPRACGSFAKIIRLAREYNMPMEQLVHKLTAFNAARFGLGRRGLLAPGYHADIAVFDPGEVRDRATYEQPRLPAQGMRWVLVNGQVAVRDGEPTGALAGRALRRMQ